MSVSAIIGHVCAQHLGSDCSREQCIWYRSYLITENHDLPHALAFAYENRIASGSKKQSRSLQRDPNLLERHLDKRLCFGKWK